MPKRSLWVLFSLSFFLLAACSGVADEDGPLPTATLRLVSSSTPTVRSESALTPVGTPISPEPTPTPFVHVIQQGETLLEIVFRYGVTLENLVLANPDIDPNLLSIGDEIRIPGPEGDPVDVLLPTPTPVAVQVQRLGCSQDPSLSFVCLISVTNTQESMIADVSALITLFDIEGHPLDNQIAYAPINRIPAGQEIPLTAVFTSKPTDYAGFNASLISAVQVTDLLEELPVIEVVASETVYKSENRMAEVQGRFAIGTYDGETLLVRVVGVALSSDGEPIGMNIWEKTIDASNQEEFEFAVSIFSLGPEIASVSIQAEVRPN